MISEVFAMIFHSATLPALAKVGMACVFYGLNSLTEQLEETADRFGEKTG